jgi:hypothetical protein
MKELLPYIISKVGTEKAKYEVHNFDSGAIMVDIFIADKLYVIQIYGSEIGLSLVTEDTALFDITPDRSFKDESQFKLEFEKIFHEN